MSGLATIESVTSDPMNLAPIENLRQGLTVSSNSPLRMWSSSAAGIWAGYYASRR